MGLTPGLVEAQVVAYTGRRGKYVAMASIELCHTYQLTEEQLDAVRQLLLDSFPLGVTEDDFYNALGGIHALARGESGVLLAHGSVVPRRMFHQGRSIRTGYVEAVAVAANSRRQGLGSAIMDSIEHVIAGAYEMGALSASRDGAQLYAGRAWQAWRGTTSVVSPFGGIVRTPDDDDSVQVLVISATLDRDGDLACDWRNGDVW